MRNAEISRKTRETEINLKLNLDGNGEYEINTGIGFLDHLLSHIAVHGRFDLTLQVKGDLHVDNHHTVEDCALALGTAFDQALDQRLGIVRMGSAYVPMDEALAFVAVDLSGRPYTVIQADWHALSIGSLPTNLILVIEAVLARDERCPIGYGDVVAGLSCPHQGPEPVRLGRVSPTEVVE